MADLEQEESPRLTSGGSEAGHVQVSIGARFLELFSAQLYTSPNKAFEELVSNSWDAGAGVVHIGIPDQPDAESLLWVLDDGVSMDLEGLDLLWSVADDHKARADWEAPDGREQIGMFGIGKLATFVLANQITYICRGSDGRILALTVDYREVQEKGAGELHVQPVDFEVREIDPADLETLLAEIDPTLPALIPDGLHVQRSLDLALASGDHDGEDEVEANEELVDGAETLEGESDAESETEGDDEAPDPDAGEIESPSEFGGPPEELPEPRETWTLAVLGELKARGTEVRKGTVKRVLRASLPLSPSIELIVDGQLLEPNKLEVGLVDRLVFGESFAPDKVEIENAEDGDEDTSLGVEVVREDERPGLKLEGLEGAVTGEIKIYERSIAGGRSAERARSNGFFINVKGRVINMRDERFGMPAMSHGVWSKLRITVRADGLNEALSVSRETVDETRAVNALRGLLRSAFNEARRIYEDDATWPGLHEILTNQWGTVPLTPLLNAVSLAVEGHAPAQRLIDISDVDDTEAAHRSLREAIESDPGSTLNEVKPVRGDADAPLARYELATRSVLINNQHPFYVEQLQGDHDPSEILQTAALVELLTDAYLIELGVAEEHVEEARRYRDQVERLIARAKRRSAPLLADILLKATTSDKALEMAVHDTLDGLGFQVFHQAQRGKPEGIATAALAPEGEVERRYRFIYEAKSTNQADGKVSTKDVNVSGQSRHRRNAAADTDDEREVEHALVVAPNFRAGALEEECEADGVCPMRARDLARLLMATAATGPLDLGEFREVLKQHDPDKVAAEIERLITESQARNPLSIQELVEALVEFDHVDQLSMSVIADRIRQKRGDGHPRESDVRDLIGGLQMLVPEAIQRVGTDRFMLGTSPERLAEAVRVQAAALPEDQRFDLDQLPALELGSEDAGAAA